MLELPPIELAVVEDPKTREAKSYEVRVGARKIGAGLIVDAPQSIRGPAAYYPALVRWAAGGTAWPPPPPDPGAPTDARTADETPGPLALPTRSVLAEPVPGTMTIELSSLLRSALAESRVASRAQVEQLVPPTFSVTLRYALFGSFYGVGPGLPAPADPLVDGRRYLVNVMLIVERLD